MRQVLPVQGAENADGRTQPNEGKWACRAVEEAAFAGKDERRADVAARSRELMYFCAGGRGDGSWIQ